MAYEIHTKDVPARSIATVRRHTSLARMGETMQEALSTLTDAVKPAPGSLPFAVYHNEPFTPEDIDVEIGLTIDEPIELTGGDVQRRRQPAATVAYTTHVGSYNRIDTAYRALFDWVKRTGHRATGLARETYVVGPEQARSPDEYRTLIELPIE